MADASCRRPLNLFSPGAPMLWRRFRGNATFACASCLFLHPQKHLWGAHGNFFGASGAIVMPRTHIFSFWATFWDCLGHLGVPGWSGAGFIRNLGYLWSALWTSISKFLVKKVILGLFFLELSLYFFWGGFLVAFAWMCWSPEAEILCKTMRGLFKIKVSRKLEKYAFGCDWYAIFGVI